MQQGSGAISPLSQPSPLKNFVLGVTSSSAAIHWSCLYGIRRVRKLISSFTFNSQWIFPSLFYLSLPLLFHWLLHISSFLFTSFLFFSSFLYCFLFKKKLFPLSSGKDAHSVPGVYDSSPWFAWLPGARVRVYLGLQGNQTELHRVLRGGGGEVCGAREGWAVILSVFSVCFTRNAQMDTAVKTKSLP